MEAEVKKFIDYVSLLKGDEKGEAQVFCDRLFRAFGHDGYKEAGAELEFRVKGKAGTNVNFADLLWENKVLIEMKKRGSKLQDHRSQLFDYWWKLRPNQPKYSILCNFDEFVIYDFSAQDEPLDTIKTTQLIDRYTAFAFLFSKPETPVFSHNLEEATRETADKIASVFNSILARGEDRDRAQRFILQSIFAMFAEDYKLLPSATFTRILQDCKDSNGNSYDLFSRLFNQMNSPVKAKGGRFIDVEYFNGGLFANPEPIELTKDEIKMMLEASNKNWNKVSPVIFGTIFQSSMGKEERHAFGAHFTSELDILKIVHPTIIKPWKDKIAKASTLKELKQLRKELAQYKVLDPACGSGNFLYVAYRQIKKLEIDLLSKIQKEFPKSAIEIGNQSIVSIKQFYGIDFNGFAVELAKVTLMLAKEVAIREADEWINTMQMDIAFRTENKLPLDNMDGNIFYKDALFYEWPTVDTIIGNPPFQSKNKIREEFGIEYVNKLRKAFPQIPGRADYCAYWFYKSHQNLKQGGYAGLVGTNTIRQNYTRKGSLEYIYKNDGIIFNAVSSQPWSGDAVVHVSIASWRKGEYNGTKLLYTMIKDELVENIVDTINSSLSLGADVTEAKILKCNKSPKLVFQGQTHGHKGFLINNSDAVAMIAKDKKHGNVVRPYLIGKELVGNLGGKPERHVVDFTSLNIYEAKSYKLACDIIEKTVKQDREIKSKSQEVNNLLAIKNNPKAKINRHHIGFYAKWWQLSYGREEMIQAISNISRYISCSRVSSQPIFEFISSQIRPNDALMVFAFEDDYSFGIIHSKPHILWYKEKCSTLKSDPRYTTDSVWDTFPFPQNPKLSDVKKVSEAAKNFRAKRNEIMKSFSLSLRDVHKTASEHGNNELKDLQKALDNAVIAAYGFNKKTSILSQLLSLNFSIFDNIKTNTTVQKPGLPDFIKKPADFISTDSINF